MRLHNKTPPSGNLQTCSHLSFRKHLKKLLKNEMISIFFYLKKLSMFILSYINKINHFSKHFFCELKKTSKEWMLTLTEVDKWKLKNLATIFIENNKYTQVIK